MGLKTEFLHYLSIAKKDANKKNQQLLIRLKRLYYRKIILDTPLYAKKIAAFIHMLFYFMPEVKRADLQHIKILPLCKCCNQIATSKRRSRLR